jgi:hypothetical protein
MDRFGRLSETKTKTFFQPNTKPSQTPLVGRGMIGVTVPCIYAYQRPTPRLAMQTDFPVWSQSNNSGNRSTGDDPVVQCSNWKDSANNEEGFAVEKPGR